MCVSGGVWCLCVCRFILIQRWESCSKAMCDLVIDKKYDNSGELC